MTPFYTLLLSLLGTATYAVASTGTIKDVEHIVVSYTPNVYLTTGQLSFASFLCKKTELLIIILVQWQGLEGSKTQTSK